MAENQPPTPPGKGLFGAPPKPQSSSAMSNDMMATISSMNTRLRVLEEKNDNLRNKLQVSDQNIIDDRKKVKDDVTIIHQELDELKHDLSELKDKFKLMIKEIQGLAPNEDLQTLKKYIEYWDPIKFVTRVEVKKIVKDELEKK